NNLSYLCILTIIFFPRPVRMAEQFAGNWKCIGTENLTAYLKKAGAHVGMYSYIDGKLPFLRFEIEGDDWTMISKYDHYISHKYKFKLGQEFIHKDLDDKDATSLFMLDGTRLVQIMKLSGTGRPDCRIERTVEGDRLISVARCNGIEAKRIYEKYGTN
ncbi:hypothetical protein PENTCL1PPCAC_995, partial [Pristionchus entomophagus]